MRREENTVDSISVYVELPVDKDEKRKCIFMLK